MLNSTLFVPGSIHQGDERFNEISRGRQCSFISFSALLYSQMHPVEFWVSHTVNEILTHVDMLYVNALGSQTISDTETHNLNQMPIEAHYLNQTPIEAHNLNQMPIESSDRQSLHLPSRAHMKWSVVSGHETSCYMNIVDQI